MLADRPSEGAAEGLLVLHHGRGTDETDLIGLADLLDPQRRFHVAAPRAPLALPGSPGFHWYVVPRVGHPDHDTFHAARAALGELHDRLWEQTGLGPNATVLGGFSMGAVMSHTMALSADRPAVAGLLAFSGFVPVVDDWEPHFDDKTATEAFIAHGENDPVIGIEFGRRARDLIEAGGLEVSYHESAVGHQIDPAHIPLAAAWLSEAIPAA
jgi:phospholipase/carboxylesterase